MELNRQYSNPYLINLYDIRKCDFFGGFTKTNISMNYREKEELSSKDQVNQALKNNFTFGLTKLDTVNEDSVINKRLYIITDETDTEEKINIQINQLSENHCIKNQGRDENQGNNKDMKYFRNNQIDQLNQKTKKIFLIKKMKHRNMGRRKKNKLYFTKARHNKFIEDNIIRKVKIHFINSALNYINKRYVLFQNKRNNKKSAKKLLQKLKPNFTKYLPKKDEQDFLPKKLSKILEGKVSERCKRHKEDENEKQIKKLIEENEAIEIINFLNKTVKEAYEIYIGKNGKGIPDFNLANDLKKIRRKNGIEYEKKYKSIALELISRIKIKGRK